MISQIFTTIIALMASAEAFPIAARDTSGTPVASTSIALPTTLTNSREADPAFMNQPMYNTGLGVQSTTDFGIQYDPAQVYIPYRDGGGSCSIGNRTLWFFCDTTVYRASDKAFMGMATNSMSVANDLTEPANITDCTSTKNTGIHPAIPYTPSEAAVSNAPSTRFGIWTYTNCIPTGPNTAVHMWQVNKFSSKTAFSTNGVTMAEYTVDPVANTVSITRDSQFLFTGASYAYGSYANVVVDGVAYLYGVDITYSSRKDLHVAKVPVSTIKDQSTWQYYDAGAGTWNSTAPVPTARRASAAVISNSVPFATGGTVLFSEYHNAFLLVFYDNYADSTFRVLTAPSPVGPWTVNNKVLWKQTPGSQGYNYGGLAHPSFYTNDEQAGKNLLLHYTYRNGNLHTRASELTFA